MATKNRLLVTGISGFLGSYIAQYKQDQWEILGTFNKNKVHYPNTRTLALNLNQEQFTEKVIKALKPKAILHLAAASNPNFCEKNEAFSYQTNVSVTINLARIAAEMKIPFIFTSTDLVFDGQRSPYHEYDITNPISVYARHKIMAEEGIHAVNPSAIIARMPLLYGMPENGKGFMKNWVHKLQKGEEIQAFTDEFRTAVDGNSAAAGLFLLLQKNAIGTWHLGGKDRMSRFDFAQEVARHLSTSDSLVIPSLQKEVEMPAARPPDVSLDSTKAFDLGYRPKRIRTVLSELIR